MDDFLIELIRLLIAPFFALGGSYLTYRVMSKRAEFDKDFVILKKLMNDAECFEDKRRVYDGSKETLIDRLARRVKENLPEKQLQSSLNDFHEEGIRYFQALNLSAYLVKYYEIKDHPVLEHFRVCNEKNLVADHYKIMGEALKVLNKDSSEMPFRKSHYKYILEFGGQS